MRTNTKNCDRILSNHILNSNSVEEQHEHNEHSRETVLFNDGNNSPNKSVSPECNTNTVSDQTHSIVSQVPKNRESNEETENDPKLELKKSRPEASFLHDDMKRNCATTLNKLNAV